MKIVVLDRGFVYAAASIEQGQEGYTLMEARCIRRWGTTGGLPQLATEGPQNNTVLEAPVTVRVPLHSVNHVIDCEESAWSGK